MRISTGWWRYEFRWTEHHPEIESLDELLVCLQEAYKTLLYEKAKEIHMERFPYNDFLFQKYDEEPLLPEDSDTTGDGD